MILLAGISGEDHDVILISLNINSHRFSRGIYYVPIWMTGEVERETALLWISMTSQNLMKIVM